MRRMGAIMLTIIVAILIGVLSCIISPTLFIMGAAGIIYAVICIVHLKYGLLLTILARSSLDVFSTYTFQLPLVGAINLAALLGIWVVLLAVFGVVSGRISVQSPLTPVFLVFLAVTAFSSVINGALGAGLDMWLKFASLVSFYLLVYNIAKENRTNTLKLIDMIIVSSVIPLAMGAVQYFTGAGNHMTEGLNRLNATFVHPNPFAYYLLIVIASCFISIYKRGAESRKSVYVLRIIILAAAFIELILTYTRGAWIGLALMIIVIFHRIDDKRKFRLIVPLAICAIPFVALVIARFSGVLSSHMEDSSLATRLYIWRNMISLSMQSPITGHGLGTFTIYAQETINWHIEAHNEYLRTVFETGIIGLAAYMVLMLQALFKLKGSRSVKQSVIQLTVFSLFLAFMVMSFADNIFDNMVSQWYLWGLTAMVYAERAWTHESSVSEQILLPEGGKRGLLFCAEQDVPGS